MINISSNEFGFMEDWDLQAVVRGPCSGEAFTSIMNNNTSPSSSTTTRTTSLFAPVSFDEDLSAVFPEIFASSSDHFDGLLEGFCGSKPFCSALHQPIITTTTPNIMNPKQEMIETQKVVRANTVSESAASGDTNLEAKPRRRKNQQKRVVQQVTADGLPSDMWAWRKYGQKPIKGSPYPRSYYRCSSSKGCLARKQVERSSSDPSIFIITYTAEHSHPHPTRRNSLAGTTRVKYSLAKLDPITTTSNDHSKLIIPRIKEECASPNLDVATPNSMASAEDIVHSLVQHGIVKNEEEEQTEASAPAMIFSDELFPSLEDLEGIFLDQFADTLIP